MKKTLVVPIDFTPVSHEALLYACELSIKRNTEIVAVHVLDTKFLDTYHTEQEDDIKEMALKMESELVQKSKNDLDNFLEGLSAFYGDILLPVLTKGTIYDAFNFVAQQYNAPLIVMGTHGIVGMQHIFGSKAYKVVVNTPIPFLIVQERSFNTMNCIYIVFKNKQQFEMHIPQILTFSGFFDGGFIVNILSDEVISIIDLPVDIQDIISRFTFVHEILNSENIIEHAYKIKADAIGFCVEEAENLNEAIYGISQDKILVNKYKFPVLCLPSLNN